MGRLLQAGMNDLCVRWQKYITLIRMVIWQS